VTHRLISGGPIRLELEALVTWRDVHGERGAWADPPAVEHGADGAVVDGAFRIAGPGWQPAGEWYRGVHARAEAERGLNADEDVWFAGRFTAELSAPGALVEVSAWAGDLGTVPLPAAAVVRDARTRAADVLRRAGAQDAVDARLVLGADAFVTTGPDVVAGYPWFGSWSRDTMTSYEGLFLETGRADEGRQLLTAYAATLSEGMLANTADTGSTEYNTADATLWFLHAVDRHVVRTGDRDLGTELLPGIDGVIKAHIAGTRYGIRVADDGLLTQGEPGYALTWMDARIDGIGVTPRAGKPVEINALWIHGLAAARRLRRTARQATGDLDELIRTAQEAFRRRFPSAGGGLYDVIDGPDGADPSVRPNQLLALGLPDAPVSDRSVLTAVAGLLTPLGLRSLEPTDPAYLPRHRGGPRERDAAYHQGTVWPWLVGPYTDAARTVGADPTALVEGLVGHLSEAGLGSVSETADAGPPHGPTGCPFQAWSVAELLRARRTLTSGPREEAG
jgi:predicted glycogen debranching enzyme